MDGQAEKPTWEGEPSGIKGRGKPEARPSGLVGI